MGDVTPDHGLGHEVHGVACAAREAERAKWETEIERKETEIAELRQSLAQASDDASRLREAVRSYIAARNHFTVTEFPPEARHDAADAASAAEAHLMEALDG